MFFHFEFQEECSIFSWFPRPGQTEGEGPHDPAPRDSHPPPPPSDFRACPVVPPRRPVGDPAAQWHRCGALPHRRTPGYGTWPIGRWLVECIAGGILILNSPFLYLHTPAQPSSWEGCVAVWRGDWWAHVGMRMGMLTCLPHTQKKTTRHEGLKRTSQQFDLFCKRAYFDLFALIKSLRSSQTYSY